MGKIWELDFYSRPILDENKKKVWEVLICESPLEVRDDADSTFRYAQYCSSTQVNSVWLREALDEAMAQSGQSPQKIRFFRTQMNNMITKACNDLGISVDASRRTFTLNRWLEQRMQEVYPHHPGFQANVPNPSVQIPTQAPEPLPDALVGQQWAFVSLEAAAFEEMHEWEIDFREAFPVKNIGITPDTMIPGLIIFSSRALPLAGWLSGLDLASIKIDNEKDRLLLETGVSDRWILANLKDQRLLAEAKGFEQGKQKAQGVHFLAVQSDPQAESFAGFWLLQELGNG
jgi:RNA-binding protein Tab2/Atab2